MVMTQISSWVKESVDFKNKKVETYFYVLLLHYLEIVSHVMKAWVELFDWQ